MRRLFPFIMRILIATLVIGCSPISFKPVPGNNGQGEGSVVASKAYLRIHPENPRYFQDAGTKEPVIILSYSFDNLVPTSWARDYLADLKVMKDNNVNYTRVWHQIPWEKTNAIWPWAKSQNPGAMMGGNKFDLTKWNDEYWVRMKDALKAASAYGITSEVILFDKGGISKNKGENDRWGGNPWNPNNNINAVEIPTSRDSGLPEFYQYDRRPVLRGLQEAYVKKMIDETVQFNVIYEIENEHGQNDSGFGNYWGQFVKNYIASKYPKHPRLVAYNSIERDLNEFFQSGTVDIINKHPEAAVGRYPYFLSTYIESHWSRGKPININDLGSNKDDPYRLRRIAWIVVMSGGHVHIEGANPAAKMEDMVNNIQAFMKASSWDFIHASPNRRRSPGGFCMVQENVEYVCYYTKGGAKRLDLPSGSYRVQWWNTQEGGFAGGNTASHPGGEFQINAPSDNDWVLHIKKFSPGARGSLMAPPASVCGDLGFDADIEGIECPAKPARFGNDVKAAIDQATGQYPELFDFNNKTCFNCYFIKDSEYYHWYISEILAEKGLCSSFDGEEIGVKNSNSSSEQYDIELWTGHIRYGAYTTTCSPPQVQEGPMQ